MMAIPAELLQKLRLIKRMEYIFDTMLLTYAECDEDRILFGYLHPVRNGSYVDVGAAYPTEMSVSKLFYDRGWRGVNIDPVPANIALYERERPGEVNLCLAASNRTGEAVFYEGDASSTTISTFDGGHAATMRQRGRVFKEVVVRTETLQEIFAKHCGPEIHFLKIDAEIHEREVLEGMDFSRHRPWLVVVEAAHPLNLEPNHQEWEHLVLANSYLYLREHGLSRYYCTAEKKQTLEDNFLRQPVFTPIKAELYGFLHRDYLNLAHEVGHAPKDIPEPVWPYHGCYGSSGGETEGD